MKILYYEVSSSRNLNPKVECDDKNQGLSVCCTCKKRKDIKKRYIQNYF